MIKKTVLWLRCPLVLLGLLCLSGPRGEAMAESTEGRFYTAANIWFERPDKILSTNYHRGNMIPAGTEVKIVSRGRMKIVFTVVSDLTYTLVHVKRHSTISLEELFSRHFSRENVMEKGGEFSQFTSLEKKNIKMGTVAEGMRKHAVLMAYGYPPSHKTRSPSENMWIYWRHRMAKVFVYFGEDGKVKQIRDQMGL